MIWTTPLPYRFRLATIAVLLTVCATGSAVSQTDGTKPQEPTPPPAQSLASEHAPIVDGHELQPRQDELATPDISNSDAKFIDDQYRQLMQDEARRYPRLFDPSTTR